MSNPDKNVNQVIEAEEVVDAPTPAVGAGKRRIDLSSLRDVRLELAALYRKIDAGELASQDGTRRAYILRTIADVIAMAELEKRIEELESARMLPSQRALPERTLN